MSSTTLSSGPNHSKPYLELCGMDAAKFLKMQFNDGFVKGYNASILLSTVHNTPVELDDDSNVLLYTVQHHVYFEMKEQLEKNCPDTVSCADIIALMARVALSYQFGKSLWEIPTGRREGGPITMDDATRNIPSPYHNFTQLEQAFGNGGDLVVLSVMLHDERAKSTVEELEASNEVFPREFSKSVVKMGRIGVLTGKEGEIRKKLDPGCIDLWTYANCSYRSF